MHKADKTLAGLSTELAEHGKVNSSSLFCNSSFSLELGIAMCRNGFGLVLYMCHILFHVSCYFTQASNAKDIMVKQQQELLD